MIEIIILICFIICLVDIIIIGIVLNKRINKIEKVVFSDKEKDDMYNYLISLKTQEENKTKHSIKCYNCKRIVDYTDNDVKDAPFVICPECKTKIYILD